MILMVIYDDPDGTNMWECGICRGLWPTEELADQCADLDEVEYQAYDERGDIDDRDIQYSDDGMSSIEMMHNT